MTVSLAPSSRMRIITTTTKGSTFAQHEKNKTTQAAAFPFPAGVVREMTHNDVLLGRGSGPNDHVGNVNFRKIVSTRRTEYLTTSTRTQKARIAREILDVVWNLHPPGRFLEKAEPTTVVAQPQTKSSTEKHNKESSGSSSSPSNNNNNNNTNNKPSWNIVSEEKALEKVKQALRQMRHRRNDSNGSTSSAVPDCSSIVAVMGDTTNTNSDQTITTMTTITNSSSTTRSSHRRVRSAPASSFDFDTHAQKQPRAAHHHHKHRRSQSRSGAIFNNHHHHHQHHHHEQKQQMYDMDEVLSGESIFNTFDEPLFYNSNNNNNVYSPMKYQHAAAFEKSIHSGESSIGTFDLPQPPSSSMTHRRVASQHSTNIYETSSLKDRMYDSNRSTSVSPQDHRQKGASSNTTTAATSPHHALASSSSYFHKTTNIMNSSPTTTNIFYSSNHVDSFAKPSFATGNHRILPPRHEDMSSGNQDDMYAPIPIYSSDINVNKNSSSNRSSSHFQFMSRQESSSRATDNTKAADDFFGTVASHIGDDEKESIMSVEPLTFNEKKNRRTNRYDSQESVFNLSVDSSNADHWKNLLNVLKSDSSLPEVTSMADSSSTKQMDMSLSSGVGSSSSSGGPPERMW